MKHGKEAETCGDHLKEQHDRQAHTLSIVTEVAKATVDGPNESQETHNESVETKKDCCRHHTAIEETGSKQTKSGQEAHHPRPPQCKIEQFLLDALTEIYLGYINILSISLDNKNAYKQHAFISVYGNNK